MSDNLFDCCICLHLLNDPVTLACGHNYCMKCIDNFWDQNDREGVYSCPQCRQTFTPRPGLKRNTLLTELLERRTKSNYEETHPGDSSAPLGDVLCDACVGEKHNAVKFCLVCLASYCETHLKPHFEVRPLRRHKLVQASREVQQNICSIHDKLLEVYCRTDQQFICPLCAVEEHKGHDTVSTSAERREKQEQMEKTKHEILVRTLNIEGLMEDLRQAADSIRDAAWEAVDDFDRTCSEQVQSYIRYLEKKRSALRETVGAVEKAAVDRTVGLLGQLNQEVSLLKRKDTELKQLSLMDDPIQFLQRFRTFSALPAPTAIPRNLERMTTFVSEQKATLKDMCKEEKRNMLITHEENVCMKGPAMSRWKEEPLSREYPYICLTVDPNTVPAILCLSDGNTTISWSDRAQCHPDHPDRFTSYLQALCTEGLTGRHSWEVEWDGGVVEVAVSYRRINRKGYGNDCCFGHNNLSWSLACSASGCTFWHNNVHKANIAAPRCSRVRVQLDHSAGKVSFYSSSGAGTLTLLHEVQTVFTEPVYPGFGVDLGATLKICKR